jgi:hypothetical protein
MKTSFYFGSAALLLAMLACDFNIGFSLPTGTPASTAGATATPPSPYDWPAESGACTLTTNAATVLYNRPSTEAQVFSEIGAGFSAVVSGRTVDGWVGFDPGVAQAANIGVFRLRWVHFDEVSLSGDCVSVSQLSWVPQPDLCYFMPMENVTVYASANTSASVIATLEVEDFASVTGYTNDGWAQIDLGAGNTGLTGSGWVEQSTLNVNGGTCDELPEVTP